MYKKLFCLISLFWTIIQVNGFSVSPYPKIKDLEYTDVMFNQYSAGVANARRAIAEGKLNYELPLEIYVYRAKKMDSIISIAARCCIPYDAIVSLNSITSIKADITNKLLLLPTLRALYLSKVPVNSLEKLVTSYLEKEQDDLDMFDVSVYSNNKKKTVICIPDAVFDGTTRSYFLRPYYLFPLPEGILTSSFGFRKDPFTGKKSYHPGIDLAAPRGTPVFAVAGGEVITKTYNSILGNHIMIQHKDGRISVYGHLSSFMVSLHDKVKAGKVIGKVGSTGRATGPHLHFEIRDKGAPKNPQLFLEKRP